MFFRLGPIFDARFLARKRATSLWRLPSRVIFQYSFAAPSTATRSGRFQHDCLLAAIGNYREMGYTKGTSQPACGPT